MANGMQTRDALLGDIAACIGFFTRLPVSGGSELRRGFASALWAAPVAGIAVGFMVAVVLLAAQWLGLPVAVAAALALAAGIAITGALHEDGLADVADGFGGGRTPERKLEIMRDSRIGSYGALALMLSVLVRWAALTEIAIWNSPAAVVVVLVSVHAASRALLPAMMARLPNARPDGLAAGVGAVEPTTAAWALAIGAATLLVAGFWYAVVAAVVLAAVYLAIERLAVRQVGGRTGDVLGALQQAGEIALFAVACATLPEGVF